MLPLRLQSSQEYGSKDSERKSRGASMNEKEVGELLQQVRREKKLKLKKAAADLRIRQEFLEAIEMGRLSKTSAHIYPVGYIKSYAAWLGLDPNEISAKLKEAPEGKAGAHKQSEKKQDPLAGMPQKPGGFSIGAFIPAPSFSFLRASHADARILPVNGRTLILSIAMALVIYGIWSYHSHKTPENLWEMQLHPAVEHEVPRQEAVQVKGLHVKAGRKMVLVADKKTMLMIYDDSGQIVARKGMEVGETYFLGQDQDVYIDAKDPTQIEVYEGPEGEEFLGTLKDISD